MIGIFIISCIKVVHSYLAESQILAAIIVIIVITLITIIILIIVVNDDNDPSYCLPRDMTIL